MFSGCFQALLYRRLNPESLKIAPAYCHLADVSDIFYFFLFWGQGKGTRRLSGWQAASVFIENRGRGGGSAEEEAGRGEQSPGECLRGGGGGLNIRFGVNAH